MMLLRKRITLSIVWMLFVTLGCTLWPFASAQSKDLDPELNFFKGKIVRIIVSTKPGGGYDIYARTAVTYMQKYLPECTIIVKNVPGAGHIIGTNEIYNSKPDGLTFGMGNHKGLLFSQLAGAKGIQFDLRKMSWLANVAGETQVVVLRKGIPYKSIEELKNTPTPIRMGASGVGSSSYNFSLMVREILGLNFKLSTGYSGSEADMAMIRSELDGQVGAWDNLRSLVESGEANVFLMIGMKRLPQFPDVPLIKQFTTPENKDLINLMHAMVELGRPIVAPPGMAAGRLRALRRVIEQTFKDPELLEQARKIKIPIDYTSGEETLKMFEEALNQPPKVVALVRQMAAPVK